MARAGVSFEQKAQWLTDRLASGGPASLASAPSSYAERHYAVAEIATMWGLSSDAVRKLFQDEPGVLVLGGQGVPHKRRYTTLRIPESVLQRVHRRMTNV
jgi:hypothetical protein